ncbi:uncharacterized protein [Antedon mediterranea]|uniref:uncharacterized protein n=1 Tax=Antedon mediterranea TaxID=105859 RepID=UPI003AF7A0A4
MAAPSRSVEGRINDGKTGSYSVTNTFALLATITSVFYIIVALVSLQIQDIEEVYTPLFLIKTLACSWAVFQLLLFVLVKLAGVGKAASHRSSTGVLIYKTRISFWIKLRNVVLLFFLYVASCIAFQVISVLYGAYIFENIEETFVFSVLMSTLVSLPCLLINELNQDAWNRLIIGSTLPGVESYVLAVACCSLLGAWLGALPIPLDWDRPWQVWPISCSIGVVIGHGAGLLFCTAHAGLRQLRQYQRGKTKLF